MLEQDLCNFVLNCFSPAHSFTASQFAWVLSSWLVLALSAIAWQMSRMQIPISILKRYGLRGFGNILTDWRRWLHMWSGLLEAASCVCARDAFHSFAFLCLIFSSFPLFWDSVWSGAHDLLHLFERALLCDILRSETVPQTICLMLWILSNSKLFFWVQILICKAVVCFSSWLSDKPLSSQPTTVTAGIHWSDFSLLVPGLEHLQTGAEHSRRTLILDSVLPLAKQSPFVTTRKHIYIVGEQCKGYICYC